MMESKLKLADELLALLERANVEFATIDTLGEIEDCIAKVTDLRGDILRELGVPAVPTVNSEEG